VVKKQYEELMTNGFIFTNLPRDVQDANVQRHLKFEQTREIEACRRVRSKSASVEEFRGTYSYTAE